MRPGISLQAWRMVDACVESSDRVCQSFVTVSPSRENPCSTSQEDAGQCIISQYLNISLSNLCHLPGADRKSIPIRASGLDMPIAYHHVIGSRFFVDIVRVLRYSSSSSELALVPKSSRVRKRLSCIDKLVNCIFRINVCQSSPTQSLKPKIVIQVLQSWMACNMLSIVPARQVEQHQPISQAISLTEGMLACTLDGAL
jgi:hypothetical protein